MSLEKPKSLGIPRPVSLDVGDSLGNPIPCKLRYAGPLVNNGHVSFDVRDRLGIPGPVS